MPRSTSSDWGWGDEDDKELDEYLRGSPKRRSRSPRSSSSRSRSPSPRRSRTKAPKFQPRGRRSRSRSLPYDRRTLSRSPTPEPKPYEPPDYRKKYPKRPKYEYSPDSIPVRMAARKRALVLGKFKVIGRDEDAETLEETPEFRTAVQDVWEGRKRRAGGDKGAKFRIEFPGIGERFHVMWINSSRKDDIEIDRAVKLYDIESVRDFSRDFADEEFVSVTMTYGNNGSDGPRSRHFGLAQPNCNEKRLEFDANMFWTIAVLFKHFQTCGVKRWDFELRAMRREYLDQLQLGFPPPRPLGIRFPPPFNPSVPPPPFPAALKPKDSNNNGEVKQQEPPATTPSSNCEKPKPTRKRIEHPGAPDQEEQPKPKKPIRKRIEPPCMDEVKALPAPSLKKTSYLEADKILGQRFTGCICDWKDTFGFVACTKLPMTIILHGKDVPGGFDMEDPTGISVNFELSLNRKEDFPECEAASITSKKYRAINVKTFL